MFNHDQLKLIREHLGVGIYLIMFSVTLDVGGVMVVCINNDIIAKLAGVNDDDHLNNLLTAKRSRNKLIKALDLNSRLNTYGIGKTQEEAKANLLARIS